MLDTAVGYAGLLGAFLMPASLHSRAPTGLCPPEMLSQWLVTAFATNLKTSFWPLPIKRSSGLTIVVRNNLHLLQPTLL